MSICERVYIFMSLILQKKRMPHRIYMSAYAYVNKYLIGKIKKLL